MRHINYVFLWESLKDLTIFELESGLNLVNILIQISHETTNL